MFERRESVPVSNGRREIVIMSLLVVERIGISNLYHIDWYYWLLVEGLYTCSIRLKMVAAGANPRAGSNLASRPKYRRDRSVSDLRSQISNPVQLHYATVGP